MFCFGIPLAEYQRELFVLVPDVTEQEVDPTVRQRDFIGSVGIRYGSVRIPVYFLVGDVDAR